jgi:hypothetical protein
LLITSSNGLFHPFDISLNKFQDSTITLYAKFQNSHARN